MATYDWHAIVDGLNQHLRLRSIPIGMKLFETVEAMDAIPKIRRPRAKHTTDQIVAQARHGYKKLAFTSVGESACADSWGKALKTGEPGLTIPCDAERRYGGVAADELLMAIPPRFLPGAIEGLSALAKNGLRYPIPPYGIQSDAAAGLAVSYADKDTKGA